MVEAIRQGDIPGVQLRCRQELPITAQQAWRWLTEPERLCGWLARRATSESGVAVGVRLESTDRDQEAVHEEASTLELEPPRRWVLAFRRLDEDWPVATRLTIEVVPTERGCEVSVLQQGFEHLPLSDCLTIWEFYRQRWRSALESLSSLVNDS